MAFPVDEKFVRAAEERMNAPLPESFRGAMVENNGGGVVIDGEEWRLHPILDRTDRKRISRTSNHLILETEAMRDWPGWPDDALAIAANGTGDSLLLRRSGQSFDPRVYVWSHETGAITCIAEDFSLLRRTS